MEENEQPDYDEGFVSTGIVLIEEGLDAHGDPAFRYKYTCALPTAVGLLQLVSDRLRDSNRNDWTENEEDNDGTIDE